MKDFVPYKESLDLKELRFKNSCFGYFDPLLGDYTIMNSDCINPKPILFNHNSSSVVVSAPLYQQAFRWFREKYNLGSFVNELWVNTKMVGYYFSVGSNHYSYRTPHKTYEEAELECLKKLIEIVKSRKDEKTN